MSSINVYRKKRKEKWNYKHLANVKQRNEPVRTPLQNHATGVKGGKTRANQTTVEFIWFSAPDWSKKHVYSDWLDLVALFF